MAVKFCRQAQSLVKCSYNDICAFCNSIPKVHSWLHPADKYQIVPSINPESIGDSDVFRFGDAKPIEYPCILLNSHSIRNKLSDLVQKIAIATSNIKIAWPCIARSCPCYGHYSHYIHFAVSKVCTAEEWKDIAGVVGHSGAGHELPVGAISFLHFVNIEWHS